jgi:hypothetical protein
MKRLFFNSLIVLTMVLGSCAKKQNSFVVTFDAQIIATTKTTVSISLSITSSENLDAQGIIFSIDTTNLDLNSYYYANIYEGVNGGKLVDTDQLNQQIYPLSSLLKGTLYYFKGFAILNGRVEYSPVFTFQTDCGGLGCGPAGGTIIYEDGNGGGIEVANVDASSSIEFGCGSFIFSNLADSIGSGQNNTTEIINQCATSYQTAAKACNDYEQNGFTDWYMPSIDELILIYTVVQPSETDLYGANYWSSSPSTSYPDSYTKGFDFSTGTYVELYRGNYRAVRAIRTF